MKAIRFHNYGDSGVIQYEDVPIPEIGPAEVLSKVHAAGVNPVDWKIREGYLQSFLPYQLPGARLQELAGLVDARKLKVTIEKEFPLSEAKAAQDFNQTGRTRGKIILRVA